MVHTDYLWFSTKQRREFVRITDDVARIVKESGVKEGMVLVSAMHITASVFVNDWEDGLLHDFDAGSRSSRRRASRTATIRPARTTPTRTSSAR